MIYNYIKIYTSGWTVLRETKRKRKVALYESHTKSNEWVKTSLRKNSCRSSQLKGKDAADGVYSSEYSYRLLASTLCLLWRQNWIGKTLDGWSLALQGLGEVPSRLSENNKKRLLNPQPLLATIFPPPHLPKSQRLCLMNTQKLNSTKSGAWQTVATNSCHLPSWWRAKGESEREKRFRLLRYDTSCYVRRRERESRQNATTFFALPLPRNDATDVVSLIVVNYSAVQM